MKEVIVISLVLAIHTLSFGQKNEVRDLLLKGEVCCIELNSDLGSFKKENVAEISWVDGQMKICGYYRRYSDIHCLNYVFLEDNIQVYKVSLWGLIAYYDDNGYLYKESTKQHIGKIWKCDE